MLSFVFACTFWFLLPPITIYAMRQGGQAERHGALILMGAAGATLAVLVLTRRHADANPWLAAIDLMTLLGFGAVAVRNDRWWPMLITVVQSVPTLSHFAKLWNVELRGLGYQLMAQSSSYLLEAILLAGTWSYVQRARTTFARSYVPPASPGPP